MKYLLTVSFIGTAYSGWQSQKNSVSVQSVVTDACRNLFGSQAMVTGCSRTDAGVHALGFSCTVSLPEGCSFPVTLDPGKVPLALNRYLPDDISVLSAEPVPDYFHPRYSAVGKTYIYVFLSSEIRNPFYEGRTYWLRKKLGPEDIERMNEAASRFVGTRDFRSYMASGSSVTDTVRTVTEASVHSHGDFIIFRVTANGFLYNMVRIMAGTLLEIGMGRLAPSDITEITGSLDRKRSGPTAPACGLYLFKAYYNPDWSLNEKNNRN